LLLQRIGADACHPKRLRQELARARLVERHDGRRGLEEGIAALTSRIAAFLGLDDRGTVAVGQAADLVVFDPETVQPLALQTLDDIPGGGTRMTKAAQGIPWVVVNGVPVVEDGTATNAVPGAVLRR